MKTTQTQPTPSGINAYLENLRGSGSKPVTETPVVRQNAYIKTKLEEVYEMINDCPCTDASTIKLLNIVEKLTFVVSTIAKEGGLV